MAGPDVVALVGITLFVVLVAALIGLWRWTYDVARTSKPAARSEDADGFRHNGG